jgi:hypothetical protein
MGDALSPVEPAAEERLAVARAPLGGCTALFDAVDAAVARAGVGDAQEARVRGFPHLRVNREVADVGAETLTLPRLEEWIREMAALDRAARAVELRNLPEAERATLEAATRATGIGTRGARGAGGAAGARGAAFADGPALADGPTSRDASGVSTADLQAALDDCRGRLVRADLAVPDTRDLLRARARVPDAYDDARRVLGFYAITRIPFAAGVRAWQADTEAAFATAPGQLPQLGTPVRYAPPPETTPLTPGEVATTLAFAEPGRLGLLRVPPEAQARLLAAYAPVFEVDTAGDFDRIGAPRWGQGGRIEVAAGAPVVYGRLAQTRYRGRALLQLVYAAWFDERPKSHPADPLGGRLDGLVWRVTLAPDGEPVVFDTMHPCGCYHLFFPTARAEIRPAPDSLDEWAFAPARLARVAPGDRVVVGVASGTHYVRRVGILRRGETLPGESVSGYRIADFDDLRSLPRPEGGRRSLFDPEGFVPGTERGERFIFWPMGVRNPGAMRQWGHHATAFVGRRHFDDADLIERYFTLH